jgi:TRAP-type C4-dicarboxylate transport system permease small subunit
MKFFDITEKFISRLSKLLAEAGNYILLGFMFLIVIDIILRYAFSNPIKGDYEIGEFILVVTVAFSFGFTTINDRMIAVDFIPIPKPILRYINLCTQIISLALFILLTYRVVSNGAHLIKVQQNSGVLHAPVGPFYYILAFGSAVICLVLIVKILNNIRGVEK